MNQLIKFIFLSLTLFLLSACGGDSKAPKSNREDSKTLPTKVEQTLPPGKIIPFPFRYHPDSRKMISVHRAGGYASGYPENCIASMQYALDQWSATFECDIRKSKDGVLFLMHDETLNRTTTGSGKVEDKKWSEIKKLYLRDNRGQKTKYHPPTLDEVLTWNKNAQSIFFLDIKRGVDYKDIIAAIEKYDQEKYCIPIFYNLNQAKAFRRYNQDIVMNVPIRGMDEWKRFKNSGLNKQKVVAFTGTRRSAPELHDRLHENGIIAVFGTLGNIDEQAKTRGAVIYESLFQNGVDIISTDNPELCFEVSSVLKNTVLPDR